MDNLEIKGCFDCPFAHLQEKAWQCAYPASETVIPLTRWGRLSTLPATNCPLKNKSITVSLKEDRK